MNNSIPVVLPSTTVNEPMAVCRLSLYLRLDVVGSSPDRERVSFRLLNQEQGPESELSGMDAA